MGKIEDFVGCPIKRYPTKINLNISQPRLINNMAQLFNEDDR